MPDLNLELQTMHLARPMSHHQAMRRPRWQLCRTKQHGGRKQSEDSRDAAHVDFDGNEEILLLEAFDTTLSKE
jgi:hypothetical protein